MSLQFPTIKHLNFSEHVSGVGQMVVQPGGEGAGEADQLEQTSTSVTHLTTLEVASDIVEG